LLNTISKKNIKTIDINGTASTSEFMKHLLEEIERQTPEIGKNLRKLMKYNQ
jgi:hypothetical protein